jgi:prepilin-type N-terminal cleavage/methylation domain-containing protein
MKKLRLNSQARRTFPGNSRGFVLIEALIAIALIGIVAVAILGALSTTSNVLIIADERTTAESLARKQMEYAKNQGYNPASVLNNNNPTYQKISGIPEGYSIWSVASNSSTIVISANIVGIPWDSKNNKPADKDIGLQKIALVIKHKDKQNQIKVIYTFVNNNPNWATGANITLEAYKVDR